MPPADQQPVTHLLERINGGDEAAAEELLPLVYDELHGLAARIFGFQPREHTLQATALVHEAYLKLLGSDGDRKGWDGRRHFFAVAATAMRRVLTDYARRANRVKRGGGAARVTLLDCDLEAPDGDRGAGSDPELDLLDLHAALETLEAANPRIARVVELRFLSGMTAEEVAAELGVTERSVFKDWRAGRAILRRQLLSGDEA